MARVTKVVHVLVLFLAIVPLAASYCNLKTYHVRFDASTASPLPSLCSLVLSWHLPRGSVIPQGMPTRASADVVKYSSRALGRRGGPCLRCNSALPIDPMSAVAHNGNFNEQLLRIQGQFFL